MSNLAIGCWLVAVEGWPVSINGRVFSAKSGFMTGAALAPDGV
jgi:hypothetical protein